MWKSVESTIKPSELDTTSDNSVVYVRRNITEVERTSDMTDEKQTIYEYEENEIPQKDWETYQSVVEHTSQISDIEDALMELAEMLTEE